MSKQRRKLAIYMTCHHSPYAGERLAPVGDMFLDLLKPAMPDWELLVYDVVDGHYPADLGEIDGALITGSPAAVYDEDDWVRQLHARTRELVDRGIPIVGSCFGHQLLGCVLGGRVVKSDAGWGLGVKLVRFERRDWMVPARESLSLAHVHQDQVVELPEGARRLAGDEFCPNAAFEIDGRIMTVQGHPEFTNDTLRVLTEELESSAPAEVCAASYASLDKTNDGGVFAQWIGAFLDRAAGKRQ